MSSLFQDLRFGWRMLAKSPGTTLIAVLTIALGVGVNTTIFSFVDMLWLRPLPVEEPDRLMRIYTSPREGAVRRGDSSYPDFLDLRAQAQSFSAMTVLERRGSLLKTDDATLMLTTAVVADDFFETVGVQAQHGRIYRAFDGAQKTQGVLLGYGFWARQFNRDPNVVGRELMLTNRLVTVLGILPRDFRPSNSDVTSDVWMPLTVWGAGDNARLERRGRRTFEIYARLKPEATLEQAQAELATIGARLQSAYPQTNGNYRLLVEQESASRASDHQNTGLVLLGIGVLVLMIACTNVASLLLARAEQRQKEIATRMAVGATRARVIRQLLAESLLLAGIGGIGAVTLAWWIITLLPSFMPMMSLGHNVQAELDLRAGWFAAAAALACVFLFGITPALRATQVSLTRALKEGSTAEGHGPARARTVMVVAQIALSLVLVVAAGLLVRTLQFARQVNPGFDAQRHLLIADMIPGVAIDGRAELNTYLQSARDRVAALPGVNSTAVAVRLPFWHSGGGRRIAVFTARELAQPDSEGLQIGMTLVSDRYFETIGTQMVRGRGFTADESSNDRRVMVVNQTLARQLWGEADPLGQRLRLWKATGEDYQVVGVAEDGKYVGITEEKRPYIFLPLGDETSEVALLAATTAEPGSLAPAFRRELHALNPAVPIPRVLTMREHMLEALYEQRMMVRMVGVLSALGLVLATVGLYGLMSYLVGMRTREIGIRIALGAERAAIFRMVVRRSLRLAAFGIALGLVAALFASQGLRSFLHGVGTVDLLSYGAAALVLALTAVLASTVPALRATRVDPMRSLRSE